MTFAGDVCGNFHAVYETDTSNLTKCRVRLLRGGGVHAGANATLLGVALERRGLLLVDLLGAALTDQLIDSRQSFSSFSLLSLTNFAFCAFCRYARENIRFYPKRENELYHRVYTLSNATHPGVSISSQSVFAGE